METINKLIKIMDCISTISTICAFLINRSFTLGFFLLIFTLLLKVLYRFLKNEKKIILIFRNNFTISNEKVSASRYFIIISILYAVFIALLMNVKSSIFSFILLMVIMPICYSLLSLGVFLFDDYPSNIYGIAQLLIAPIPYYLVVLMIMFEHNGFWFELATFSVSVVLYIPVGLVSVFADRKLRRL